MSTDSDKQPAVWVLVEYEIKPSATINQLGSFQYGDTQILGIFDSHFEVDHFLIAFFKEINETSPFEHSVWGVNRVILNGTPSDFPVEVTDEYRTLTSYNEEVLNHVYKLSTYESAASRIWNDSIREAGSGADQDRGNIS